MDSELLARAEALFHRIVDLPERQQRAVLDRECRHDPELRRLLDGMLAQCGGELKPLAPCGSGEGPPPGPLPLPSPGSRFGRYEIIRLLGHGGMGQVYLALQDQTRREVALKILRADVGGVHLGDRFRFEIQALARLNHEGIAQIFEADTTPEGQAYFAMEYVPGRPLTDHAAVHDLSLPQKLDLVLQICDAIGHAHGKDLLHRDLKPANILVTEKEDGSPLVRIVDFGVARPMGDLQKPGSSFTEPGQLVGTMVYMSPEQVQGRAEDLDARSDLYQIGVIMYELLGDDLPLPIQELGLGEAVDKIAHKEPKPLGRIAAACRGDLETIVAKAMAKEPHHRYRSAGELATDIRRHLDGRPILAKPTTTFYRIGKLIRRQRLNTVLVACAILVGGFVAWVIKQDSPATVRSSPRQTQLTAQLNQLEGSHFLAMSPDGSRLAYTTQVGDIRLLEMDSSADSLLVTGVPGEKHAAGLSWYPDGGSLLVEYWGQPYGVKVSRHELATGQEEELFTGSYKPRPIISPHGRSALIILDYARELALLDLDTGAVRTVIRAEEGEILGSTAWAPDGRRIAFYRSHAPDETLECLDLITGEKSILLEDNYLCNYPFHTNLLWLPDDRLLYVRFRDASITGVDLWAMPMDPRAPRSHGAPQRIHSLPERHMADMVVSADGSRLVFGGRKRRLTIRNFDLGSLERPLLPREVTTRGWPCFPVGWSPSQDSLILREINDRDITSTLLVDPDRPEVKVLECAPANARPLGLAGEGGSVVVKDGGNLMLVDLDCGETKDLGTIDDHPAYWMFVRRPEIHPGGDLLLTMEGTDLVARAIDRSSIGATPVGRFPLEVGPYGLNNVSVDVDPTGKLLAVSELKREVKLLALDGADPVHLPVDLGMVQALDWGGDGWIYCTGMHNPEAVFWLGRVHSETGKTEMLWSSNEISVNLPAVSPDGRHIAVQFKEMGTDFFLLEGF